MDNDINYYKDLIKRYNKKIAKLSKDINYAAETARVTSYNMDAHHENLYRLDVKVDALTELLKQNNQDKINEVDTKIDDMEDYRYEVIDSLNLARHNIGTTCENVNYVKNLVNELVELSNKNQI